MKNKGILIYFDSIEQLELIPDADRGRLLIDLLRYAKDGVLPEFDSPIVQLMFSIMQKKIDKDAERYEEVCRKRAEAGRKGLASRYKNEALANVSKSKQMVANDSNCQQLQANDSKCKQMIAIDSNSTLKLKPKEIYSSNEEHISFKERGEKTQGVFTPPSLEEVKEYIREKGYIIDAESFINFYESKGWMVGKNKMKNWRAALVTWELRHKRDKEENEQHKPSNDVNAYWENDS